MSLAGATSKLIYLLLCFAVTCEAGIRVRLLPKATVSGSVVTLGDIADLPEGDDEELVRLRALTISPAPEADRSVRLDYNKIRSRIRAAGFRSQEVELTGASIINVHAESGTKKNDRPLLELIRQDLIRLYENGEDFELSSAEDPEQDSPSEAHESLEILDAEYRTEGPSTVTYRIGNTSLRKTARIQLRPLRKIPVLNRPLERGEVISADDLIWKQSDKAGFFESAEDVVGKVASLDLKEGHPVRPSDVRAVVVVQRRDLLEVASRIGSVSVTTQAVAQQNGAIGDVIDLVTVANGAKLKGRITDKGKCDVLTTESTEKRRSLSTLIPRRVVLSDDRKPQRSEQPVASEKGEPARIKERKTAESRPQVLSNRGNTRIQVPLVKE